VLDSKTRNLLQLSVRQRHGLEIFIHDLRPESPTSSAHRFYLNRKSISKESRFESAALKTAHLLPAKEAQCIGGGQRQEQSAGRRKTNACTCNDSFS
jgi:hypothetical protein